MTPSKLKERGLAGWIVGPSESEEDFVKRIDTQLVFRGNPGDAFESLAETPKVLELLEKHLQVKPQWILVRYSNQGLRFWEGAASWTYDFGNWIQLRKAFKKGHFLFYDKEEVILHEALHSLRTAFNEPRFEEMMAHAFTKKKWRRFLGPLFSAPRHLYLFAGSMILLPFAPYIPLAYFAWRLGRLMRNWRLFNRALKKIQVLFPTLPPYALLFRLTDKEIQLFGSQSCETVQAYIDSCTNDFRWKQFRLTHLD